MKERIRQISNSTSTVSCSQQSSCIAAIWRAVGVASDLRAFLAARALPLRESPRFRLSGIHLTKKWYRYHINQMANELFKQTSPERRYQHQLGMARVDRMLVPAITNKSFVISADLEAGDLPAEGAILICGNRFGGFAFYCADGSCLLRIYLYEIDVLSASGAVRDGQARGLGHIREDG